MQFPEVFSEKPRVYSKADLDEFARRFGFQDFYDNKFLEDIGTTFEEVCQENEVHRKADPRLKDKPVYSTIAPTVQLGSDVTIVHSTYQQMLRHYGRVEDWAPHMIIHHDRKTEEFKQYSNNAFFEKERNEAESFWHTSLDFSELKKQLLFSELQIDRLICFGAPRLQDDLGCLDQRVYRTQIAFAETAKVLETREPKLEDLLIHKPSYVKHDNDWLRKSRFHKDSGKFNYALQDDYLLFPQITDSTMVISIDPGIPVRQMLVSRIFSDRRPVAILCNTINMIKTTYRDFEISGNDDVFTPYPDPESPLVQAAFGTHYNSYPINCGGWVEKKGWTKLTLYLAKVDPRKD